MLLETRNISRAAELLNLSQPSISKQLGQLRSEFGDELLVREGQRWLLTRGPRPWRPSLPIPSVPWAALRGAGICPERCGGCFGSPPPTTWPSTSCRTSVRPWRGRPRAALEYSLWDKRQLPQLWQSELDMVSTITELVPDQIRGLHQGRTGWWC